MGIGEYWKELRKSKEEVEAEKPKVDPSWEICECCLEPIEPKLVKTFMNKKMHKKCFKKNIKMTKKAYGF